MGSGGIFDQHDISGTALTIATTKGIPHAISLGIQESFARVVNTGFGGASFIDDFWIELGGL